MSWDYEVIARQKCGQKILDTLREAEHVVRAVVEAKNDPRLELTAEFFDIASNTRIANVADETWTWSCKQYLWVRFIGVRGGIDIETEPLDDRTLAFLADDMRAREVTPKDHGEMMKRAKGGVHYTMRLSFFQPTVMYLTFLALGAALAEAADGRIYTTDPGWLSAIVPISGQELAAMLLDVEYRRQSNLQKDVDVARQELTKPDPARDDWCDR